MIQKDTSKQDILKLSVECKQCGKCCEFGVGFASENEAKTISQKLKKDLGELFEKHIIFNQEVYKPKQKTKDMPFGPCIFLKNKKCKIHEIKPLHCVVGNCNEHGEELTEWFYANHLVDFKDPQSIFEWNTRVELKGTIKGASPKEMIGEELTEEIKKHNILTKEKLEEKRK